LRNIALAKVESIKQTPTFKKTVKKLKHNQKKVLDIAVKKIIEDPEIGEQKSGDLAFMRVHKFTMVNQLMLLGYSYVEETLTLELLNLGVHENFYRDSKRLFN